MKKIIKYFIVTAFLLVAQSGPLFSSILFPKTASAYDCSDICNTDCNVPDDIKEASGCSGYNNGKNLDTVIINILQSVILSLGLVAAIYVVIGGSYFLTAAGNADKVTKGRHIIIWACVGLAVCALAFALVNFVVDIIQKA
ncbi:MAG: pilin [Candidatus Saccharibacteria bacterium]|nr:pilin [Candidatus Saccharibacteria bacterium]